MTMTGPTTTNRYLNGAYAPVTEEVTAFDLPVTGTIPAELDGRYLRNGPNPFGPSTIPTATTGSPATAWSTACACATGEAEWYRNRWVRSTRVSEGLGEDRRRASASAASTAPTPTPSATPAATTPSSRPGLAPSSSTTS